MKISQTRSHYCSIKTAWSESFGMKKPLWHHANLESAHMKLRLTTRLMRIVWFSVANLAFFPRIRACFFCGIASFCEDMRVACFWVCFNWNLLVFWACFFRFLFCGLLFFKLCGTFLFQFIAKDNLGVFCENIILLGVFFRMCLPVFLFSFAADFLFCWIFLLNACWACFSVKLPILGLFFKFTCLFLQNNLASLVSLCHMRPVERIDQFQCAETPFSAGKSVGAL